MKLEFLERFQQTDTLIQEHKTGTPADLAQTVGVLKRTIYQYKRVMKNLFSDRTALKNIWNNQLYFDNK